MCEHYGLNLQSIQQTNWQTAAIEPPYIQTSSWDKEGHGYHLVLNRTMVSKD
jgi:hypothetical protein